MFVSREATILHADVDSFFASVEQRDDPRLRNRPVIVGGGVVLAASYEAKAFGIRTAMSGRRAHQLCPQAIVVEPRFAAYTEASRAMYRVFDDTTPVVEGLSIDEAEADLVAQGFKTSVVRVASDEPADTVVDQSPATGKARKGAEVQLSVSKGPAAETTTTTTETTTTTTVPATTTSTTTTSP